MSDSSSFRPGCCGITRRGFLLGAGAGLAAGAPLGWLGLKGWQNLDLLHAHTSPRPAPAKLGMPGAYPGRVIEVRNEASINDRNRINKDVVRGMIDTGMRQLTHQEGVKDAWCKLFEKDDVIGIKVNPVGRAPLAGESGRVPGAAGSISNPEVLLEIVQALKDHVGVRPRNIIVFERYANEFIDAGYEKLMREPGMSGTRWFTSSFQYDDQQVAIDGQQRGNRHPNVVGYDPDHFVDMGFTSPQHDSKDDRATRSHLSLIVTKMVNKIITIPVLKDHRSSGVTLALKNMSHGFNNNVCRSHIGRIYRRDGAFSGPNQCNTFIPTAVNQPALREKATLHILDGLIAVYEGGPGCWNRSWGTWQHKGLFFATDPVAMDHIGWEIIDRKRATLGWSPVGHMGQINGAPQTNIAPNAAALMVGGTPFGAAALLADHNFRRRVNTEAFDRRQPEHIILAGMIGLGTWDAANIHHKVIQQTSS